MTELQRIVDYMGKPGSPGCSALAGHCYCLPEDGHVACCHCGHRKIQEQTPQEGESR